MITLRDRVTASLIILVPLAILWEDIPQGHLLALYLSSFICLALSVAEDTQGVSVNKHLALFMLYNAAWFAYWLSRFYVKTIPLQIVLIGIDAILVMMVGVIIYNAVSESKAPLQYWYNHICIAVAIQAALCICQHHFFNPVESVLSLVTKVDYGTWGDARTAAGSFGNTNYAGAFLAIGLPLFLHEATSVQWRPPLHDFNRNRWNYIPPLCFFTVPVLIGKVVIRIWKANKWILASPFVAYALYLTHCRTAMIAVLIVGAFHVYRRSILNSKYSLMIGAALATLLIFAVYYLASYNLGSFKVRYDEFWRGPLLAWVSSWHTFIFGVGPGVPARGNNFLHSEIIPLIWNFGLLGVLVVGDYIKKTIHGIKDVPEVLAFSFFVILIDALGNHVLHIPATALMCIFIVALIEKSLPKLAPSETRGGLEEALRRR